MGSSTTTRVQIDCRALTIYGGRTGDRNPHAMAGAVRLGEALASHLGISAQRLGVAKPPLSLPWHRELEAARLELLELSRAYDALLHGRRIPITTFGRCACALATLPVVARHRPDATIVWFDAHGDVNVPDSTTTGYLGGLVLSGAAGLWDTGLGDHLSLSKVILIGARDLDPFEAALVNDGTIRLIPPSADIATHLKSAIGKTAVYVHIDCDVLEPGIVPTEYRVSGGLSLADLHAASTVLAGKEVVGLEVAEFEERWPGGQTASPMPVINALAPLPDSLGGASQFD